MSTKATIRNKLRSSLVVFSLPFLAFASFFEEKPEEEFLKVYRGLSEKSNSASDQKTSPDVIAPGTNTGMWVWKGNYVTDPWERILMLDFCQTYGIKSLFIQVHFDRTDQGDYVFADQEAWAELLSTANELGIRIEALDGDSNMAFTVNHADTIARLKAVLHFNKSQPPNARFSGIHYDIEPYTTPRWSSGEQKDVAVELLELLTKLRKVISKADPSLTLANDIPFWYDGDERFLIKFNGAEKYLNEHIQDISNFIGVMSYRTKMTGDNSTSEIIKGELAYGAKIGRSVYAAIETAELPETPNISFFGGSAEVVVSAIRELCKANKSHPSFEGVYMHDYNSMRLIFK